MQNYITQLSDIEGAIMSLYEAKASLERVSVAPSEDHLKKISELEGQREDLLVVFKGLLPYELRGNLFTVHTTKKGFYVYVNIPNSPYTVKFVWNPEKGLKWDCSLTSEVIAFIKTRYPNCPNW